MASLQRTLARTLLSLPSPILRLMSGGAAVYRGGRTLDPRFQFMAAQAARMPAVDILRTIAQDREPSRAIKFE